MERKLQICSLTQMDVLANPGVQLEEVKPTHCVVADLMALARLDIPALFVYGGTILPGTCRGQDVDIVSVFEAVGKYSAGKMTLEELTEVEAGSSRESPSPGMPPACSRSTSSSAR